MNNNEDFLYIEDCKNDIYALIKDINDKCTNLEDLYKEYLQEVLKHDTHLMSLDVLFFQIELTYEDKQKVVHASRSNHDSEQLFRRVSRKAVPAAAQLRLPALYLEQPLMLLARKIW